MLNNENNATIQNNQDNVALNQNDNDNLNDNIKKVQEEQQEERNEQGVENDTSKNLFVENDFIDFEKSEELSQFKDIFKDSKISQKEYQAFVEKAMEQSSPEMFHIEAEKVFGENYNEEIELFQNVTKDIFDNIDKNKINMLPAESKVFFLKAINTIAKESIQIKKDYGINTVTKAIPQPTTQDNKSRFLEITKKLTSNDFTTKDEYSSLLKERIELAGKM